LKLKIRKTSQCFILPVKAVPGSSRTRIAGLHDQRLKVQIAAAPEKGKANKELIQFFAKTFKIPKSALEITSGLQNPAKEVSLTGISLGQIQQFLNPLDIEVELDG